MKPLADSFELRCGHRGISQRSPATATSLRISASVGCLLFLLTTSLASAEPLLACGVRQHVKANVPEGMQGPFGPALQETTPWVEDYQRSDSGEWISIPAADSTDKTVKAVLWTPNGPIAIQVEVTIDGVPYRQMREKLIETVRSNKPSTVVAAVKSVSKQLNTRATDTPTADAEQVEPTISTKADLIPRLKKHFRNREIDTEEAQWLLNEWIPGPTIVSIRSGYVAERAKLSPVLAALDSDGDGKLSRNELQHTQTRLRLFDKDENEVIERSELATQTNDAIWYPTELFSLLGQGKQKINKIQYEALPAIELRASFGKQSDPLQLELVRVDPRIAKQAELDKSLFATDDALVIERPRYRIEFVACQAANYAESHGQVSMGAVVDGLPLWRELDQDGNERLERRERMQLEALLKKRDRNRDGTIEPSELRSPIRLAIGCGPVVHEELANPAVAITRKSVKAKLPKWFVSMDLNQDSELSRTEFIGTDEQFSELDIDRDEIIGSNEVPIENE